MKLFDYNFCRLYYWYKRRKTDFNHVKLIKAANYAISIVSAYISVQTTIAIAELFQIHHKQYILAIGLILGFYPSFGNSFRYLNEEKALSLLDLYQSLDKDLHEELKSKTWSLFWLVQLFCLFCFLYHSYVAEIIMNQIKNYF